MKAIALAWQRCHRSGDSALGVGGGFSGSRLEETDAELRLRKLKVESMDAMARWPTCIEAPESREGLASFFYRLNEPVVQKVDRAAPV